MYELKEAINSGLVGYNEKGRIKLMTTGEELPTMYGMGGMRELLKFRMAMTVSGTAASTTVSRLTWALSCLIIAT